MKQYYQTLINFPYLVDGYELIRKYKPETCDSKYQISSTPDQFTDTCAAMCDENDSCKFFFFAQSNEKQRCTLFTNCDDRGVPVPYAVGATYKKSDGNIIQYSFSYKPIKIMRVLGIYMT